MRVATVKNDDGSYEIYFIKLGGWNDFKLILNTLIEEGQCSVVEEREMVTDKDVLLKLVDDTFLLSHHYMMGNYLFTQDSKIVPLLEQLAQNVINCIKQKLIVKGLL